MIYDKMGMELDEAFNAQEDKTREGDWAHAGHMHMTSLRSIEWEELESTQEGSLETWRGASGQNTATSK